MIGQLNPVQGGGGSWRGFKPLWGGGLVKLGEGRALMMRRD